MDALVASGAFRRDLLYRINVVTVRMPPLRDRREDIPLLASTFAKEKKVGDKAMEMLIRHAWPGNVRELRNVVERATIVEDTDMIRDSSLPVEQLGGGPTLVSAAVRESWTLEQLEERYIREVLVHTRENYSRAAEILGINRKTLLEKRRKYGIE
jgi:two-component system response regulator HydG